MRCARGVPPGVECNRGDSLLLLLTLSSSQSGNLHLEFHSELEGQLIPCQWEEGIRPKEKGEALLGARRNLSAFVAIIISWPCPCPHPHPVSCSPFPFPPVLDLSLGMEQPEDRRDPLELPLSSFLGFVSGAGAATRQQGPA